MANVNLSAIVGSTADRTPKAIIGRNTAQVANVAGQQAVVPALAGAMTANVYKNVLTLTTPGLLKVVTAASVDVTARTITLRITLDGFVVFEGGAAFAGGDQGFNAVGQLPSLAIERIPFKTCVIDVRSTVTETDKIKTFILYETV